MITKKELDNILGNYERPGSTIKNVGKFLVFTLDDPFHLTTIAGGALYLTGSVVERRSPMGIRESTLHLRHGLHEMRRIVDEINAMRLH